MIQNANSLCVFLSDSLFTVSLDYYQSLLPEDKYSDSQNQQTGNQHNMYSIFKSSGQLH